MGSAKFTLKDLKHGKNNDNIYMKRVTAHKVVSLMIWKNSYLDCQVRR